MNIKYIISISLSLILLSSCTKNFEEINENPNNPSTTDVNYIFNYIVKEAGGEFGIVTSYNYSYVQRWIMQTAAVWGNSTMPPYTVFDQYRIKNLWEYYYSKLLLNCHTLVEMTKDDPLQVNKHEIARIWEVFCFHKVTDLWGDIPYSEAFQVLDEYNEETIRPAYDSQEDIYADFLVILKDAVSKIDPTKAFYTSDLIFDGDTDLWIKFANSLRLRLAVRSGNEDVVSELITEDNLIGASESAIFEYIDAQEWWNPYYEINIDSKNPTSPELTGTTTPKISELMKLQLEDTNDPRLAVYAQTVELDNTSYRGVPNLMNANKKENQAMGMGVSSTSYIGKFFSSNPKLEKPLLSYSEVCFLRSEAAFRNWSSDNAQEWYEKGVRSTMSFYGIAEDDIQTFLAGDGAFNNSLEQIMVQKWISLYLNGWEAFSDYRRTGFPQLKKYNLELDGIKILSFEWVDVDRNTIPGRLPYPDDEIDLNKQNYLKAVEDQDGDSYYQQVWWSKTFGIINY